MSVESVATGSGSSSSSHGARIAGTNTMITKRGTGGERKGRGVPRSLMISPNLDALLEHEDRMRQSPVSPYALSVQTASPRSGASSATISPSGTMELGIGVGVGGLPPPPRRTRGPKSPLTLRQVVAPIGEAVSSTSNPYINRAPTLADVLGGDRKGDGSNAWRQQSGGREGDGAGFVEAAMGSSGAGRRRPLLSHGHSPSLSSDSTDSHAPPSTAEHEPRISISSTVYPASDADHSLDYNSDMSHRRSFIDIYSPDPRQTSFSASEPVSPLLFARASLDSLDSASDKPPVPTTPKPTFTKPTLRSRQSSPKPSDDRLPPTTNFLDVDERADLVRKSRKLARVFGQTPGADAMAHQDTNRAALPVSAWRAHSRKKDLNIYASRRHSMPLTPDDISFLSLVSPTFEESNPASSSRTRDRRKNRPSSPTSFIDLSEDHTNPATDPGANTTAQTPPDNLGSADQPQPHPNIDSDAMSSLDTEVEIETAEELERRRKRERLAKLHRFLGSRVPANLVLGIDDVHVEASLPPPQRSPTPPSASKSGSSESDEVNGSRKPWMKRRRSSSVIAPPSSWCEDIDRLKEELDDKEKAINVRRAQKMEKVFGVAPPQTLYHTRHSPSPSVPAVAATLLKSAQVLPSGAVAPTDTPALPGSRNPNRTSYIHKSNTVIGISSGGTKPGTGTGTGKGSGGTGKGKKNNRPGTSESAKGLLQKGPDAANGWGFDERLVPVAGGHAGDRNSNIYSHYQHSLNSLGDILDRDDRESLAELHEYLNTPGVHPHEVPPSSTTTPAPTPADDSGRATPTPNTPSTRRLSSASLKSERRRSLPARTSLISLASLSSLSSITSDLNTPTTADPGITTPKADVTSFQLRRRRAAKLTQFFGVDYRELISDVLESIENGVQAERQRGTLREDEVQDLLAKLRNLKTKRQSFI